MMCINRLKYIPIYIRRRCALEFVDLMLLNALELAWHEHDIVFVTRCVPIAPIRYHFFPFFPSIVCIRTGLILFCLVKFCMNHVSVSCNMISIFWPLYYIRLSSVVYSCISSIAYSLCKLTTKQYNLRIRTFNWIPLTNINYLGI